MAAEDYWGAMIKFEELVYFYSIFFCSNMISLFRTKMFSPNHLKQCLNFNKSKKKHFHLKQKQMFSS